MNAASLVEEAAARAGPRARQVRFTENLDLLVTSCRETAHLNALGWDVLRKAAVRHLRNLHYLDEHVETHPDVARRPLGQPIVITGLPRTGTTLLHNLLALDPAHRVLPLWQALHPVPPHAGGPAAEELRVQAGRWLEAFDRLVPGFRAIHPSTVDGPEECDALLQNAFASQHFDDMFDAEEYSRWLATARLDREYGHYALQLRALSEPSGGDARWVLKSPSHLGHLDALLTVLPGCTVVVCHREPRQAVASYASLVHTLRRAYSDAVTPARSGRQALARTATAMQRALEVRRSAPNHAFVDVSYSQLVSDPLGAVRRVYQAVGRGVDGDLADRVRDWLAAHPQHEHGPHRYGLSGFGLTPAEVDEAFAAYRERFAPLAA